MEVVYPLKKELSNKHGGVVLVGDYLYGDSDDRGIPYCAELMTGDIKWKSRGAGHDSASVAVADGHLYIHYADGTMTLVKASPDEFQEVGHFIVPGSGERPSWGPSRDRRRQALHPRRGRAPLLRREAVARQTNCRGGSIGARRYSIQPPPSTRSPS